MNASALGSASRGQAGNSRWEAYKGWLLGLLIIVIVLLVGAGLWFHFHP
jgi:uncharacterized membrane protein